MYDIKRGQIWLINLDPTIGREIKKSRPCVIIQNDVGNLYSSITIIASITSQGLEKIYPIEVLISKQTSGLDKNSKVLLNQIRAIDKKRLVLFVGKVDYATMQQIDKALQISLGIIPFQ